MVRPAKGRVNAACNRGSIVELVGVVRIASVLVGGRPAAFVCGNPPRILVAHAWPSSLNDRAEAVWGLCRPGKVLDADGFTAFPTQANENSGDLVGALVVVAAPLEPDTRRSLLALARMTERMNVSMLASLVKRLQDEDPEARGDLVRVLVHNNYNMSQSARSLGMSRVTLYKHVRRLRIPIRRVPAALRSDLDEDEL